MARYLDQTLSVKLAVKHLLPLGRRMGVPVASMVDYNRVPNDYESVFSKVYQDFFQ